MLTIQLSLSKSAFIASANDLPVVCRVVVAGSHIKIECVGRNVDSGQRPVGGGGLMHGALHSTAGGEALKYYNVPSGPLRKLALAGTLR